MAHSDQMAEADVRNGPPHAHIVARMRVETPKRATRVPAAQLERPEEAQQRLAVGGAETLETAPGHFRLACVTADRVFGRGRRTVVQQRPAEAQAPERRSANLVGLGRGLANAVAGSHVVEEEIREERYGTMMELRVGAGTGRQRRHVARGAAA